MSGLSAVQIVIHVASSPLVLGLYATVLCERVLMLCAQALKLWEQGLAIKRSGGAIRDPSPAGVWSVARRRGWSVAVAMRA